MPELPDVETEKRKIESTSLDRRIERTGVSDDRVLEGISGAALARRLKGEAFREARRHGKHLFLRCGDRGWMTLHFGMTGTLRSGRSDELEKGKVTFDFEGGDRLIFECPRLFGQLGWTDSPDRFIRSHELGPDALSEEIDSDTLESRLEGRRGALKAALMNQSILAGIGNVYSDEILFQCGLHPETPVDRLSRDSITGIFRTMRRVLRTAVRHRAEVDDYPDGWLLPVREGGGACPACGASLEKKDVSGRSAVFCSRCQK